MRRAPHLRHLPLKVEREPDKKEIQGCYFRATRLILLTKTTEKASRSQVKNKLTVTQYHFRPFVTYLDPQGSVAFKTRTQMRIKVQSRIRIRITSQSNLKLKLTKNGGELIHILQCLLQNSAKAGVF